MTSGLENDVFRQNKPFYSCPSAPAEPGATLLGVLGQDGKVQNLLTKVTIDKGFVETAKMSGAPEARMRFAARCQEAACQQWTGSRCTVIDKAMAHIGQHSENLKSSDLPACTIRRDCRWFAQIGPKACQACSSIVTDSREQGAG